MGNELWLDKEFDLLEGLQLQEYQKLIEYAKDNQQFVISSWYNQEHNIFEKTLRLGASILGFFEKHLKKDSRDSAIFNLGTLNGVMTNLDIFLHEEIQNELAEKLYKEQVLSVKHLADIIILLETHGIMTHSEICEALTLKTSTLSEIMKKISLTQLIDYSRSGKYKIYRLTDSGRRLGKQLRLERGKINKDKEQTKLSAYKSIDTRRELQDNRDTFVGKKIDIIYDEAGKRQTQEFKVLLEVLSKSNESNESTTRVFYASKKRSILEQIADNNYEREGVIG